MVKQLVSAEGIKPSTHHKHEAEPASAGRDMRRGHDKAAEDHSSNQKHAGHNPKMFRDKFGLSLILTGRFLGSRHSDALSLRGIQVPRVSVDIS
jgi:hypothetical protein